MRVRELQRRKNIEGEGGGLRRRGGEEGNEDKQRISNYTAGEATRGERQEESTKKEGGLSRLEGIRRPRQQLVELPSKRFLLVVLLRSSRAVQTPSARAWVPLHRTGLAHGRRSVARAGAAEPVERIRSRRVRGQEGGGACCGGDGAGEVGRQGGVGRGRGGAVRRPAHVSLVGVGPVGCDAGTRGRG